MELIKISDEVLNWIWNHSKKNRLCCRIFRVDTAQYILLRTLAKSRSIKRKKKPASMCDLHRQKLRGELHHDLHLFILWSAIRRTTIISVLRLYNNTSFVWDCVTSTCLDWLNKDGGCIIYFFRIWLYDGLKLIFHVNHYSVFYRFSRKYNYPIY